MENTSQLFNPFKTVWSRQKGSLNHAFQWLMFDQILLSHNFFDPKLPFAFDSADVYEPNFLKQHRGKYKGQPFRTFVGPKYKGGYSDHFPVYVTLKTN
jgi:hypothetical protein